MSRLVGILQPCRESWISVLGAAFGWARSGFRLEMNCRMVMSGDAKRSGKCNVCSGREATESRETFCDDEHGRIIFCLPRLPLNTDYTDCTYSVNGFKNGRYYDTR